MSTKKTTTTATSKKYIDLISKTTQDVEKELLQLSVEQAENVLEQGILSVKSQLLSEQGKVKSAEISVTNEERHLSNAKQTQPFDVQFVLNARHKVLVAKQSVESAKSSLKQVQESFDFLVALKEELF